MTISLADDAFIDKNDFAINATWNIAASSDNFVVTGIFNNDYYPAMDEYGVPVTTSSPQFTMKTDKIPTGAKVDDALTLPVNDVDTTYKIKIIERDGTGISLLHLQKN